MTLLQRLRRLRKWRGEVPAPIAIAAPCPASTTAATIDLVDPFVARNPFPFYEALRPAGPVQWLPRHCAWIVLSHDAVKEAFARPEHFSNAPYKEVDPVLLGEDPPRQPLVRRLVSRHFTPAALQRLEATAARTAKALLQPQMDAVGGFSQPVSRAVGAELIGFDAETVEEVSAAADAAAALPEPMPALVGALHGFAPRAAIYRTLLRDGEGLIGEDEARSLVALLWLASFTTTERVIARCVIRLLEHPHVHRTIAADATLIGPFIEEVMRLHPPEHLVPRLTTAPARLADTDIPASALVYLSIGAANRDPAQYNDPAGLRLDRAYRRHFAFGGGIHHCVGAPLARRVAGAALGVLLPRSGELRPLGPIDANPWFAALNASCPLRLNIVL
jgi:cytochrome P450